MQAYFSSGVRGRGEGALRLRDLWPSAGSVAVGVAARGALMMGMEPLGTHALQLGNLVVCALVAVVCVLGVGYFERGFLVEFVPGWLMERVLVLRGFMIKGDDDVGGKKDR